MKEMKELYAKIQFFHMRKFLENRGEPSNGLLETLSTPLHTGCIF